MSVSAGTSPNMETVLTGTKFQEPSWSNEDEVRNENGGGSAGYEGAGQTDEDFKEEVNGIYRKQCNFNRPVITKMSEL